MLSERTSNRRGLLMLLTGVAGLPALASAQTWAGLGLNGNWSSQFNWSGGVVPTSGASTAINYTGSALRLTSTNDIANPFTLNRLNFLSTATGSYTVQGSPFRLDGPVTFNLSSAEINMDSAVNQTIATDIELPLTNTSYSFQGNGAGTLFMNGSLTGQGILRKAGSFTLQIGKPLTASSGPTGSRAIALDGGTLRLGANDVISSDIQLIQSGGVFDLNGRTQTLDIVFRFGGTINLGGGTLSIGSGSNGGKVGGLVGAGTVIKNSGNTEFDAPSPSFTGQVRVKTGGTVFLSSDLGLGTAAGNTIVEPGASLVLSFNTNYATPEPLTLQGLGSGNPALQNAFGSPTFAGPITLTGHSNLGSAAVGLSLTLTGGINLNANTLTFGHSGGATIVNNIGISGTGGIVKRRFDERLILNAPSTYTGPTTVSEGILDANASLATSAISVASGATLRGTTIATNAALSVSGSVHPGADGIGVGRITVASASLALGAALTFDIQNATGIAGVGYDHLAVLGGLAAPDASGVSIVVRSLSGGGSTGAPVNFDPSQPYVWTLIEAASLNANVSPADFTLNTSAFTPAVDPASFSLSLTAANDLVLRYAPVPEPATLAGTLGAMGLTLRRHRRSA
jgi:autotransporter-associated beta strand protein